MSSNPKEKIQKVFLLVTEHDPDDFASFIYRKESVAKIVQRQFPNKVIVKAELRYELPEL